VRQLPAHAIDGLSLARQNLSRRCSYCSGSRVVVRVSVLGVADGCGLQVFVLGRVAGFGGGGCGLSPRFCVQVEEAAASSWRGWQRWAQVSLGKLGICG
jgi:hypothetical protein